LEPACLAGCPTNAYEKDPVTGIVRHLDDQCFGCQYCTMTCPYEVPQFSASKGIVRKCDMCHGRLAAGEAPACVQACPTQAIRISIVDRTEVLARTSEDHFLPGAPPAKYTHPTTIYRGAEQLPPDTEAVDHMVARPQHAHLPLVALLVLTQAATGGFVVAALGGVGAGAAEGLLKAGSFVLGLCGVAAATLHLGRPQLAFRGVLGWRHSWMSREAIAFGMFLPLAAASAAEAVAREFHATLIPPWVGSFATPAAAVAALVGVYSSIRIYQVTQRELWQGWRTSAKFWLTAAHLGSALTMTCCALARAVDSEAISPHAVARLTFAVVVSGVVKMFCERAALTPSDPDSTTLDASANLCFRTLWRTTHLRYACGFFGVMLTSVVPLIGEANWGLLGVSLVALVLCSVGELTERALYFRAVVPLRMPGGIAA
jgi:DMSO reductase anchor subunit/ferredoxin